MPRGRPRTLRCGLVAWVDRVNRPVGHPSTVASQTREVVQPKSLKYRPRAARVMMGEVMFWGRLSD